MMELNKKSFFFHLLKQSGGNTVVTIITIITVVTIVTAVAVVRACA